MSIGIRDVSEDVGERSRLLTIFVQDPVGKLITTTCRLDKKVEDFKARLQEETKLDVQVMVFTCGPKRLMTLRDYNIV